MVVISFLYRMNVRHLASLVARSAVALQVPPRPLTPGIHSFSSAVNSRLWEENRRRSIRPIMMPRRSARLQALQAASFSTTAPEDDEDDEGIEEENYPPLPTKRKRPSASSSTKRKAKSSGEELSTAAPTIAVDCLPRTLEKARLAKFPHIKYVMGIDEAGRGPLAGPVVVAAVWAPNDVEGIIDSKKITKEEKREQLFEELIKMEQIQWAVCIMDAARIDQINILQATLMGMKLAATALVHPQGLEVPVHTAPSVDRLGCYVVVSSNSLKSVTETSDPDRNPFYALIDGNKVPKEMPCGAESVVKGDGKEFCIAAASILAKVTRDRLMHAYDVMYPHYNLKQHKGYPTKDHMAAVKEHGASPIHRRTFAPLKHMDFDADGKVLKPQ